MKADYFAKHSKYLVWDNIPHYSRRIVKNGKSHYFFPFRKPYKVMRTAFFNANGFTTMTCDGAKAKVTIK